VKSSDIDTKWLLVCALASGNAYLAAAWLDSKLSSHPFNDLKLVGQIFTTRSPFWIFMGLLNHYGFSVVVAYVYARWTYSRLPGPGWLRGLLFLQLENTLLYPVALLLEPVHAGIRSGQLPTLFSWKTFWGQVVRHVAYGVTLGAMWRPGR
jgi:hypothetical protein